MMVSFARIQARNIVDWPSFHAEFERVFSFPDFHGGNMNAWIDCMTSLDAPDDGMTGIHVKNGRVLTIEVEGVNQLKERCPEQYAALIECSAFVNWRRIAQGDPPVLALSFHMGAAEVQA